MQIYYTNEIFSALPKVIERSWGFQCIEIIPTSLIKIFPSRETTSLFSLLFCAIPLYLLLLVLSPKPFKDLPDRHFSSTLVFTGLYILLEIKNIWKQECDQKKRREISLMSTISWSEMRQQNNEDITVCSVNHPTTRTCRLVRRFCSRQNHLALPVKWNLFSIPLSIAPFISYDFAKRNLDFLVTFQFKNN